MLTYRRSLSAARRRCRNIHHHRPPVEPLERRVLMAVDVWTGGDGNGDFNDGGNWEGDAAPGVNDNAVINVIRTDTSISDLDNSGVESLSIKGDVTFTGLLNITGRYNAE